MDTKQKLSIKERTDQLVALYNSGLSSKDIAKKLGCEYYSVLFLLKEAGVQFQRGPRPAVDAALVSAIRRDDAYSVKIHRLDKAVMQPDEYNAWFEKHGIGVQK